MAHYAINNALLCSSPTSSPLLYSWLQKWRAANASLRQAEKCKQRSKFIEFLVEQQTWDCAAHIASIKLIYLMFINKML